MSTVDSVEIIDALVPGPDDLVTVIQAYFDESYGPDGLLCVAGYVFTKAGARKLCGAWTHMLKQYKAPYFRMSACAHGNEPFDKMSAPARDKLARTAIKLVTQYAAFGVANTLNEKEFNERIPKGAGLGSVRGYEFLVWNCLMGVRQYANDERYKGKVAYFFEAGHRSQSSANKLMQTLFATPALRDEYRYVSHAFVGKEDNPLVQAADLLAWQYYQDRRRELSGKPRRKDMEALLRVVNIVRHVDVDRHVAFVQRAVAEITSSEAGRSSP